MTVIYSNQRVKGLEGRYINPVYFEADGVMKDAEKVYTDDPAIKKAYSGIEVLTITKKKPTPRKKKAE